MKLRLNVSACHLAVAFMTGQWLALAAAVAGWLTYDILKFVRGWL